MNGSDVVVQALLDNRVKYIFGVPGDIQTDLFRALKKSPIRFITARNEKCAAFMADIYSRVSGECGVCFSTVGPGATNLVSGLANATHDRSAVVAISDQVPTSQLVKNTHQYINYDLLFSPESGVVKAGTTIKHINQISRDLNNAFHLAKAEYPGAVHIGLPIDLLQTSIDNLSETSFSSISQSSHKEDLQNIAEEIKAIKNHIDNKRVIVVAGPSINRTHCQKEFREFINRTNFPVISTFNGKGSLLDEDPHFIGTISRHLQDIFTKIFAEADVVLLIGYDYIEGIKPETFGNPEKIINLDVVDNRVFQKFQPRINAFGDLAHILKNVAPLPLHHHSINWDIDEIRKTIRQRIYGGLDMEVYPPRPHRIIEAVNKVYGDNSIIVCDVGLNKYYSGLLLKSTSSNTILFSNGMSSMAFSSGALAAKLARPDKEVVVLCGDGGFLMDLQEISTCVHYNIPITIIVFNNGGLGLIEQAQRKQFNDYHEVHFAGPDYVALAKSLGAEGYSIKSQGQLEKVLVESRKNNQVNVIEVPVNYSEGI
jgi:acetolactate synthase I/II/III large subunit